MSTEEVLKIRQQRSKETVKLRSMFRRTQKKLQLASAGEELPWTDVTAERGQDGPLPPYYLLQPRAKAANPPYPVSYTHLTLPTKRIV